MLGITVVESSLDVLVFCVLLITVRQVLAFLVGYAAGGGDKLLELLIEKWAFRVAVADLSTVLVGRS